MKKSFIENNKIYKLNYENLYKEILTNNISKEEFFLNKDIEKKNFTKYVKKLYNKLTIQLSKNLFKIHNKKLSLKALKIIINPWLIYYLENIYFRWCLVEKILKKRKKKINFFYFSNLEHKSIFDQNEFIHLVSNSSAYNYYIYQKIFSFLKKKKINLKITKKKFNFDNKYKYLINEKKISFFKKTIEYFSKFLINRNNFFIDLNFSKHDYFKLSLLVKQIPFKGINLFSKKNILTIFQRFKKNNFKIRNSLDFKFSDKILFEKFLKKNFFKDIPQCFIEKFDDIANISDKIKFNPKIIISDTRHKHNTFLKFWIAKCINNGSKFITSMHGGEYGNGLRAVQFDDEVSDLSIKWHKTNIPNTLQLPSLTINRFLFFRKPDSRRKKLLLITHDATRFPKVFNAGPIAHQTLYQIPLVQKMYETLDNNLKNVFFIKPYLVEDGWKVKKKLNQIFFDSQFLKKNSDYWKISRESKLIICTYPRTAFCEAMASGPTILLFEPKYYQEIPRFEKIMKKLFEAQIAFTDPKKASLHINKYWNNLNKWWHNQNVINARKEFFSDIVFLTKKPLTNWSEFLKKELKNFK